MIKCLPWDRTANRTVLRCKSPDKSPRVPRRKGENWAGVGVPRCISWLHTSESQITSPIRCWQHECGLKQKKHSARTISLFVFSLLIFFWQFFSIHQPLQYLDGTFGVVAFLQPLKDRVHGPWDHALPFFRLDVALHRVGLENREKKKWIEVLPTHPPPSKHRKYLSVKNQKKIDPRK